jgi:hypothetical protein
MYSRCPKKDFQNVLGHPSDVTSGPNDSRKKKI